VEHAQTPIRPPEAQVLAGCLSFDIKRGGVRMGLRIENVCSLHLSIVNLKVGLSFS